MASPDDERAITVVQMDDNDAVDRSGGHENAPEADCEAHNTEIDNTVIDANRHDYNNDDETLLRALMREAAMDPDQPSLDNGWVAVTGFRGNAVEEAYQAGHAPFRAQGLMIGTLLGVLTSFTTTWEAGGGSTTSMAEMMGMDPLFQPLFFLFLLLLAPMCFVLFRGWNTVTHRNLIFMTACTMTVFYCLEQAGGYLPWHISQGRNISSADVMATAFRIGLGPIFVMHLFRPSLWLTSATCIISSTQMGIVGYNSKMVGTVGLATASGIFTCLMWHMMLFISERDHRLSFMHQLRAVISGIGERNAVLGRLLSAMRYAQEATRQSDLYRAARRSETSASQAINHCAKRVNEMENFGDELVNMVVDKALHPKFPKEIRRLEVVFNIYGIMYPQCDLDRACVALTDHRMPLRAHRCWGPDEDPGEDGKRQLKTCEEVIATFNMLMEPDSAWVLIGTTDVKVDEHSYSRTCYAVFHRY
jgi:hypothetical protein